MIAQPCVQPLLLLHAGITGLELMLDKETGATRGFGFLEFYNNAAADQVSGPVPSARAPHALHALRGARPAGGAWRMQARRQLTRPDFFIPGHDKELVVTWAEPKRHEAFLDQVRERGGKVHTGLGHT